MVLKFSNFSSRRDMNELICFHSKNSYKDEILGIGLILKYNPYDKSISYVDSPLDTLSYDSFKEGVRKSVWREEFTHFLPIYINQEHGKKAFTLFKEMICQIYKKESFDPLDGMNLMLMLMNTQIVNVMNKKMHNSSNSLVGYAQFHRWLIHLTQKYTKVSNHINTKIQKFIKNKYERTKNQVPIIGTFISMLSVSNYQWEDISYPLIKEILSRNVRWLLQEYPIFYFKTSNEKRHQFAFEGASVMNKLLMFHYYFLKNVGRPGNCTIEEISKSYDLRYGYPNFIQEDLLQKEIFKIQKLDNYENFFEYIKIGKDFYENDFLKESYVDSFNNGYHNELLMKQKAKNTFEIEFLKKKNMSKKTDDWSPWSKSGPKKIKNSFDYYESFKDKYGDNIIQALTNRERKIFGTILDNEENLILIRDFKQENFNIYKNENEMKNQGKENKETLQEKGIMENKEKEIKIENNINELEKNITKTYFEYQKLCLMNLIQNEKIRLNERKMRIKILEKELFDCDSLKKSIQKEISDLS
jgi:hypothetical protein